MLILHFLKIKRWYIPADNECYTNLVRLGVPLTKLSEDFLPTLKLIVPPGTKFSATYFSKFFDEKMEALGGQWQSKAGRKCLLKDGTLSFVTSLDDKKILGKLDHKLEAFFARWAFRYVPTYSETATKAKLSVSYSFDSEKVPVIDIEEPIEYTSFPFVFGNFKIVYSFHAKRTPETDAKGWKTPVFDFELLTKAGSEWKRLQTGTFKSESTGNISGLVTFLGLLAKGE